MRKDSVMDPKDTSTSAPVSPYVGKMFYELDRSLDFKDELVALGLKIWREAKIDGSLPSREDFDPLRMPPRLLPHILLIDVIQEPKVQIRWRLVGTYITGRVGRDMTGQIWDEIYEGSVLDEMSKAPLWALEHHAPIRAVGAAPMEDKGFLTSENLFAPLSMDGETVNMLFAVSVLK
jgi:hypothetical protein